MTAPLSQAIERYRHALPKGRLIEFSLTPLDRLNIPVQALTLLPEVHPDNPPMAWQLCEGIGYGQTEEEARVGAYGELTEEVASTVALARLPRVTGSYQELVGQRGGRGVVDPVALCLEAGSGYHAGMALEWVEARRWSTDETVLVPVEFVACSGMDAPPVPGAARLITPLTNGHGAGSTLEMAQVHGLLELLQRDGNSVHYRALAGGLAIDPATVTDPAARALLGRYDEAGIEIIIKVAATDFGLVNLYVVGNDRAGSADGLPIMTAACGEAVHPVAEVALRKALLEFASSRARLALYHGPLDLIRRIAPPGYLEVYARILDPLGEEPRGLEGMKRWLTLSQEEMQQVLAPVFRVDQHIAFADLPTAPVSENVRDKPALLRDIVSRLEQAGLDVLTADLSTPGSSVYAVKMIVPGLEVETMTYHRIGERNVRRLLTRSQADAAFPVLVGLGDPPEGASRVPLTSAARQGLGAGAWLDVKALDAIMEDLYVLYREPSRHVTRLALDGAFDVR